MKNLTPILLILISSGIIFSCNKSKDVNYYDDDAQVTRDYTVIFDHVEVVNEEATVNVNGKLDVVEIATLNVYLKNMGPDPCLFSYGTWGYVNTAASNGFYIFNQNIDDIEMVSSEELGYKVQYITPGETEALPVKVRTYDYLDYNQDIQCFFDLVDYDGGTRHIDFTVHVE